MPQVKEFKTTCKGCGKVTFRPYVDFEALKIEEQQRSSIDKGVKTGTDALIIGGASMACLPLGCCMATDAAHQKVKQGWTVDERIKDYCEAYMCKQCHSTALTTEVIVHDVE